MDARIVKLIFGSGPASFSKIVKDIVAENLKLIENFSWLNYQRILRLIRAPNDLYHVSSRPSHAAVH